MTPTLCSSQWRDAVRNNHIPSDTTYSAAGGFSDTAAYREAALASLLGLMSNPRLRLRTGPDRLGEWLETETRATIFETESPESMQILIDIRSYVETTVLGVLPGANASQRPRYGYLRGSDESNANLRNYGTVVVDLSSKLLASATVLLGDSIGSTTSGHNPTMAPAALGELDLDCRHSYTDMASALTLADASDDYYRYAEVQIYDQLHPSMIDSAVFTEDVKAPSDVRISLDAWGIPFHEVPGTLTP